MKKCVLVIAGLLAFLGVGRVAAGGLETQIYSDNHAYSTASSPQTSTLRIAMRPSASVPNSAIEVYLYAIAPTATASDGVADFNAFDIGNIEVECPQSIPGVFDFGTPEIIPAERSHIHLNDGDYHRIICPYAGTGDVSQADFGYDNDNYLIIKNLLNPRHDPSLPNSQLIYSPIWINFSAAVAQLTITSARNVRVLATIMPQISLTIEGVPEGQTYCGQKTKKTTTGKVADFGQVDNEYFADIAQKLTATTNMINGYVITARQDDQMRMVDAPMMKGEAVVCTGHGDTNDICISDANPGGISATKAVPWNDSLRTHGMGFTLENEFGGDSLFSYKDGYRIFADQQNGDEPVSIIKGDGHRGVDYVCYRLTASDDNLPGFYANKITYVLTAKF
ncbi:hypothetical protein IJJ08_03230 [bacterium]|nr:hypothetical protein [bacterium]